MEGEETQDERLKKIREKYLNSVHNLAMGLLMERDPNKLSLLVNLSQMLGAPILDMLHNSEGNVIDEQKNI